MTQLATLPVSQPPAFPPCPPWCPITHDPMGEIRTLMGVVSVGPRVHSRELFTGSAPDGVFDGDATITVTLDRVDFAGLDDGTADVGTPQLTIADTTDGTHRTDLVLPIGLLREIADALIEADRQTRGHDVAGVAGHGA